MRYGIGWIVCGLLLLAPALASAQNTSFTQQALANDSSFMGRVRVQLIKQAFVVLAESTLITNHTERVVYARQVLNGLDREAQRVVPIIVNRTNLMAFATSYDFAAGHVVTAAGDADILSQLATDWNVLAGV